MSKILKFTLRYKFIKRETRGLELRSACSCEPAKQSRPLIPLFKSPVCLQLQDEVEVKTPRTLEVACNGAGALHAVYYKASVRQILKFMNEHITAINLVASDYET